MLIAIAIIITITNQFGTSTVSDALAAQNYRDQMRAHFLARSALNLSELVIQIQKRLDNNKDMQGMVQITDFADQLMLAFCGGEEEVKAAVGFSPGAVKGLGADIGTCGVDGQITTEDDKINMNCANGNDTVAATLKSELDALMFFPAYDTDLRGGRRRGLAPRSRAQVSSLIDYIDTNTTRNRDRGTTEDYNYEALKDPYYAKNNYIDSVGELRQARGVDDRFWSLFGSAFTIYGGCKANLSAVTNIQLISAILYLSAKNPSDPVILNPTQLFQLASLIAKSKQFGMTFSKLDDFIDFVKDPASAVGSLAATGGASGSGASSGSSSSSSAASALSGLSGGVKLGLELDKTKLSQIATAGPRRTYRVSAWGQIERGGKDSKGMSIFPPIRTTITGIWDTKVVNQNVRKPPVPNGTWVFMREE